MNERVSVSQVVALARRHAERPDLSPGAARTIILGLASKLERQAAAALRVEAYLEELDQREIIALQGLSAIRAEKDLATRAIEFFQQFESLPDMQQPAQTEADYHSGDNGDQAAGATPLVPAAPIQESPPETTPPAKTSTAEREGGDSSAPIQESDGGAFAAVKVNDRLADAVGVEPSSSEQIREESREWQTAGENPASTPEASLPEAMEPEETAAIDSSEEGDGPERLGYLPADPPRSEVATREDAALTAPERPTWKMRVEAAHAEHPEWSLTEMAKNLGSEPGPISKVVKQLGITLPPAVRAPAPRRDDSVGAKVEAYLVDHPDAVTSEIAAALNVKASSVRAAEVTRGLKIRKLTPEERSAAQRAAYDRSVENGTAAGSPRKFVPPEVPAETKAAAPPPTPGIAPVPVPQPNLGPAKQPFDVGDPDADYIHPSLTKYPAKPTGNKVSLMDPVSGFYLHDSVTALKDGSMMLTGDVDRAWRGTREQLKNVRHRHPATADLRAAAVPVRRKA